MPQIRCFDGEGWVTLSRRTDNHSHIQKAVRLTVSGIFRLRSLCHLSELVIEYYFADKHSDADASKYRTHHTNKPLSLNYRTIRFGQPFSALPSGDSEDQAYQYFLFRVTHIVLEARDSIIMAIPARMSFEIPSTKQSPQKAIFISPACIDDILLNAIFRQATFFFQGSPILHIFKQTSKKRAPSAVLPLLIMVSFGQLSRQGTRQASSLLC